MAYSEYWGNMVFHRIDRITNMKLTEEKSTDLQSIPGYKNGIDYKKLSSSMPYMYSDEPEWIDFVADAGIVDQIIDWFGNDIRIAKSSDNENQVKVSVVASPNAMEHWAMQYINYVEVISPPAIRDRIRDGLQHGISKCEKAKEAGIKIVVLYNALTVDKTKCPEAIRNVGTHLPMMYCGIGGQRYWNYSSIKDAICG